MGRFTPRVVATVSQFHKFSSFTFVKNFHLQRRHVNISFASVFIFFLFFLLASMSSIDPALAALQICPTWYTNPQRKTGKKLFLRPPKVKFDTCLGISSPLPVLLGKMLTPTLSRASVVVRASFSVDNFSFRSPLCVFLHYYYNAN